MATWFVVTDGSEEARLPGGGAPTDSQAEREERLTALLDELTASLGEGDPQELASPAGGAQLAFIDSNVERIGFQTLDLRYVAPADQTGQQLQSADTWVADVQVNWQFRSYDVAPSTLEVPMVVVDDGEEARFAGLAPQDGERVPLWLLERLAVRKSDRTLVLAADPKRQHELARLARRAVPDVEKVLPDWTGSLVLEEPSTQAVLNQALGSDEAATGQLAGVTTTVDGAVTRGQATHVLLNPEVFGGLGPKAAQIVATHEATHVATDAAVTSMPQWLAEGFADYVALRDVKLPVSVTAGQILADVRRNGPPRTLPTSADFSGDNQSLGAVYESSWLACRLIAEEYGEEKLVEFYRQADRDGGTEDAFTSVLGTTEQAFTRSWSSHLAGLASSS